MGYLPLPFRVSLFIQRLPHFESYRSITCAVEELLKKTEIIKFVYLIVINFYSASGPGSSVGIATGDGLDGPVIEYRWGGGRDFPHLSRPTLRLIQPPVQWVSGLSRG